jgi:hypothetical protein
MSALGQKRTFTADKPGNEEVRLFNARQHGLTHHADRRYPLIRSAVVSGGDGHDKIEVRHDEQSLSTITVAADPTIETWVLARTIFKIADVPLVPKATLLVDTHARCQTFGEPFGGQDLPATHSRARSRGVMRRPDAATGSPSPGP